MSKILVVVDMQNDFINGSLGTKEAQGVVENVCKKIEQYKNDEGYIFITKDTHYENYLDTQEGINLPIKHCIKGTEGHELNPSIQDVLKDFKRLTVLEKPTFGSFELVDAIEFLEQNFFNLEHIEFVGLCTDICVISNAILTKNKLVETKIVVDASCCAGVTPESHQNALNAMKMCQIDVINE